MPVTEKAFVAEAMECWDQVVELLEGWTQDSDVAEDVLAKALSELVTNGRYERFNPDRKGSSLVAFLFKCAKLRWLDVRRTMHRRAGLEETHALPGHGGRSRLGRPRAHIGVVEPAESQTGAIEQVERDKPRRDAAAAAELAQIYGDKPTDEGSDFHTVVSQEAQDEDWQPQDWAEHLNLRLDLDGAVRSLPKDLKIAFETVFDLATGHKTTLREAAEELGWTPRTVQCRLEKARALLRIKLKDYEPPNRPDGGGASSPSTHSAQPAGDSRGRRGSRRRNPGTGTSNAFRCRRSLKAPSSLYPAKDKRCRIIKNSDLNEISSVSSRGNKELLHESKIRETFQASKISVVHSMRMRRTKTTNNKKRSWTKCERMPYLKGRIAEGASTSNFRIDIKQRTASRHK
jgi:RNA polymerase sigma factor (sigma-70 family)